MTLSRTLLKLASRVAEVASGILCGCLPVIPQFFRHCVPRIWKTLKETLHGGSHSKCDGSHKSQSYEVDSWNQALVKGNYVELNENSQGRAGISKAEHGSKHGARSETKITAHRNLPQQDKPATKDGIYTERTITVR